MRISQAAWLAASIIEYYSKEGPVALYGQTSAGIGIGMPWIWDDWVRYRPKIPSFLPSLPIQLVCWLANHRTFPRKQLALSSSKWMHTQSSIARLRFVADDSPNTCEWLSTSGSYITGKAWGSKFWRSIPDFGKIFCFKATGLRIIKCVNRAY